MTQTNGFRNLIDQHKIDVSDYVAVHQNNWKSFQTEFLQAFEGKRLTPELASQARADLSSLADAMYLESGLKVTQVISSV